MPVLLLIAAGFVALVSAIMLVMTVPGLLRVIRAEHARPSGGHALQDGPALLRGRVVAIPDQELTSWFTGEPVVWRRVEVTERVGRRTRKAYEDVYRKPFLLDDGMAQVMIQPGEAVVDNTDVAAAAQRDWPAALRAHVEDGAAYEYPNTPKDLVESTLPVGCEATVRGESVLTAQPGGGTAYVVHADHIARFGGGVLSTAEGQTTLWALVGLAVGLAGSVACWWWGAASNAW